MSAITQITSREIIDSRANPTVETTVYWQNGSATASVPSGASTGKYEAKELRDNDPKRFNGRGVSQAVANVNNILAKACIGINVFDQQAVDKKLIEVDGTEDKSKLGSNSILSVSLACLKAGSIQQGMPLYKWVNKLFEKMGVKVNITLPTPLINVINGGKHGTGNLDFQEFIIVPASNKKFTQGIRMCCEIYHKIKDVLKYRNAVHAVGDEGGFAPNLFTNLDALEVLKEAITQAGYNMQQDVFLGLDIAPAFFYKNGFYQIKDIQEKFSTDQFIEYINKLNKEYRLLCLEDPLYEDDWDGWVKITKLMGDTVHIIGDDLLATNLEKLKKAIHLKAVNSILIKPNQIGTVTQTLEVVKCAKENNIKTVVSHRSGETTDYLIADFACGVGADFVKFGAPARGERTVKYNRLLSIAYETQGLLL